MSIGHVNITLEEYDRLRQIETEYKSKSIYIGNGSIFGGFKAYNADEAMLLLKEQTDKIVQEKICEIAVVKSELSQLKLEKSLAKFSKEKRSIADKIIEYLPEAILGVIMVTMLALNYKPIQTIIVSATFVACWFVLALAYDNFLRSKKQ